MITIRSVRAILTAPAGINLVVVKIETSEPGLFGLGCATFTQRYMPTASAVKENLEPLLVGRDVDRIEDLWQMMMVHSYWRNCGVLNNAISGVDIALWDIKAKRANMPLYQLFGGKCREGAAVYRHADSNDIGKVEENVAKYLEQGIYHCRVQLGEKTVQTGSYGGGALRYPKPDGAVDGVYFDQRRYMDRNIGALEHIRKKFGDRVELLHDIHERLNPIMAVEFAKRVEPLGMFFLEDALAPEDIEWFKTIRAQCCTPIAMGELFNNPLEWTPLITGRLIDFMRMHISQMGGLTPARKAAILGEFHGVKTAWHGPGDVSPVGHAANVHLDLASHNFGIQEFSGFSDAAKEVFPGCPELRGGYLYVNDKPGLGIDLNEKLAEKYPCKPIVDQWTQARLPDGTIQRP